MKKYLLILLLLPLFSTGQNFVRCNGKAIVKSNGDTLLIRSMGLGNWMVQEGYMMHTSSFADAQHQLKDTIEDLIGVQNSNDFYDAWLDNYVTKRDIDSLKSWGFNTIRPALHYNLFTLPIEDEPVAGQQTWLTRGFDLVDSLKLWCEQANMYIILDLHAAPGGQGYNSAINDYDPSKPSLFESVENQEKTVALWKLLAETYAQDTVFIGWDLINEPNWNIPGGIMLKNLYVDITDSIRSVDTNHIIFIEGNWFANDFTGLTPPWDDNMAYSPHKYWSPVETDADIEYITILRDTYNVPVWMGESGENSNAWFTGLISLLEQQGVGWSWWPLKKLETINATLSIPKNQGYNDLLSYWSGNTSTAPSVTTAKNALLQLAENTKNENCSFNRDVKDAMFRQINDKSRIPWSEHNIPGLIHGSEYDLGPLGVAYWDTESMQLNPPNSWNSGWIYRNDGVDIEYTADMTMSNGFKVGFIDSGDWMRYTVNVAMDSVYELRVRQGCGFSTGANFYFSANGTRITPDVYATNTGGWDAFSTKVISDVVLLKEDTVLTFHANDGGMNLLSFELVPVAALSSISSTYVHSKTRDAQTIEVHINKPILSGALGAASDYDVIVNGANVTVNSLSQSTDNSRVLYLNIASSLTFLDEIKVSYTGSDLQTVDSLLVQNFTQEDVLNDLPNFNVIPGKIEAESFSEMEGVSLEITSDVGGGKNIGYLDPGDYLIYEVKVQETGTYNVTYRHASESNGAFKVDLLDTAGNQFSSIHTVSVPSTGGWQTWQSLTKSGVYLVKGDYLLKLAILQAPFNLNWFDFDLAVGIAENPEEKFVVYPNPTSGAIHIQGDFLTAGPVWLTLYSNQGQIVYKSKDMNIIDSYTLPVRDLSPGPYFMEVIRFDGKRSIQKVMVH